MHKFTGVLIVLALLWLISGTVLAMLSTVAANQPLLRTSAQHALIACNYANNITCVHAFLAGACYPRGGAQG
jgi:hypothetical protein